MHRGGKRRRQGAQAGAKRAPQRHRAKRSEINIWANAGREMVVRHLPLAIGEPWLSFFSPAELRTEMSQRGFSDLDDLRPRDIAARFGLERHPDAPGAHFVRAHRG